MSQSDLVTIKNLRFSRSQRVIFDDIDLHVPKGKVTAIMGPSGIGKTTLLRLIGGQLLPEQGEIRSMVKIFPPSVAANCIVLVRR